MLALSVKPYWAHAIISLDKDIENRNWMTDYRGRLVIHSSARFSQNEFVRFNQILERLSIVAVIKSNLVLGALIGTVDVVDCLNDSNSPWFSGKYGFALRNPVRFSEPIPIVGSKGLWEIPSQIKI